MEESKTTPSEPQIEIVEHPTNTRFKYEYESKGKASYIQGSRKNLFPAIRIIGYSGPVTVIISCVTKDAPYKPHPHKLFNGTNIHKHGVCYIQEDYSTDRISFDKLGIECVAKKDAVQSLMEREKIKVDPFNTGFEHKLNFNDIQLNCVRLCFQVILESPSYHSISLDPVVSKPLYNTKVPSPNICWLSQNSATVAGGSQLCILCEKVSKNDIEVLFYHKDSNWEACGKFVGPCVFKGVAIIIETPEYKTDRFSPESLEAPIEVKIQLRRLSDGLISDPIPFQLLPLKTDHFKNVADETSLKRKREKYKEESRVSICKTLQDEIVKNQGKQLRNGACEIWELPSPAVSVMNIAESCKLKPNDISLHLQSRLSELFHVDSFMNIQRKEPIEHDSVTNPRHNPSVLTQAEVPKQFPTYSVDTLNSDSWIQDLLDVIKEDLNSTVIISNSTTRNGVSYEPDTNFVTLNLPSTGFANMTDPNRMTSPTMQNLDQFFHSEFVQETSCLNDLDNICLSDLIPDINCEIEDFYQSKAVVNTIKQDSNLETL